MTPLESFIRTAKYEPAKYDVITFNFGLHDMSYNDTDGSHTIANYTAQLVSLGVHRARRRRRRAGQCLLPAPAAHTALSSLLVCVVG